jgi:hypothetical protein
MDIRWHQRLSQYEHGQNWMKMIESRNLTFHTYNQDTANEIFDKIINYFPLFIEFQNKMIELKNRIHVSESNSGIPENIINQLQLDTYDSSIPYKIDISIFQHIDNPDLIEHIQRMSRILF